MSKEAMKLALEALEDIGDEWGFTSQRTVPKRKEAITALREALAEQPYEIGTRLAREGKGISDLWGAVKSDADMAEAQRGYEAALAEQPAQQEPKCGAIIEVFGKDWRLDYMSLPVGKHKLYTQQCTYTAPAQRTWVGLSDEAIWLEYQKFWPFHPAEEPTLAKDIAKFAKAIEAKLKERNT